MTMTNQQVLLSSRPVGKPTTDNFRLVQAPVPAPQEGQVLVRHHFLSLDPYMRGRMNEGRSYAQPQPLDQVIQDEKQRPILEQLLAIVSDLKRHISGPVPVALGLPRSFNGLDGD